MTQLSRNKIQGLPGNYFNTLKSPQLQLSLIPRIV